MSMDKIEFWLSVLKPSSSLSETKTNTNKSTFPREAVQAGEEHGWMGTLSFSVCCDSLDICVLGEWVGKQTLFASITPTSLN